jgi:hypothetical protein
MMISRRDMFLFSMAGRHRGLIGDSNAVCLLATSP